MTTDVNNPYEFNDGDTIRRVLTGQVLKAIDKDKRHIEFIISTAAIDRYNDSILVNGWDLKPYRKNPVVLFGHLSSIPPIGKSIKTWKDSDALRSIAEFMPREMSPFADSIFQMYVGGFLKAVSVGFRPLKYEKILDEEGEWSSYGYRFLKQELLEFSAVPVPANPEALIQARSAGIDTLPFKAWAEELLDNWGKVEPDVTLIYGLAKKDMEQMRRRAAGMGAQFHVSQEQQDELMRKNLETIRQAKAAKEKSTEFETVELCGQEIELPVKSVNNEEVGVLTIGVEDDNIVIKQADELIGIAPDAFNHVDNAAFTLEQHGEIDCLKMKDGKGREVTYGLVSWKDSTIYARLMEDSEPSVASTDNESDEEKAKKPKKPDNGDDCDDIDDMDNDDIDGKSVKEVDEDKFTQYLESDEGKKLLDTYIKDKGLITVPENSDEPIDFSTELVFIEATLCKFEESLAEVKSLTKHDQRKKNFLAGYMRELADRLDGGADNEGKRVKTVTDEPGMLSTAADVQKHLQESVTNLLPTLSSIVEAKLAKMTGRLD